MMRNWNQDISIFTDNSLDMAWLFLFIIPALAQSYLMRDLSEESSHYGRSSRYERNADKRDHTHSFWSQSSQKEKSLDKAETKANRTAQRTDKRVPVQRKIASESEPTPASQKNHQLNETHTESEGSRAVDTRRSPIQIRAQLGQSLYDWRVHAGSSRIQALAPVYFGGLQLNLNQEWIFELRQRSGGRFSGGGTSLYDFQNTTLSFGLQKHASTFFIDSVNESLSASNRSELGWQRTLLQFRHQVHWKSDFTFEWFWSPFQSLSLDAVSPGDQLFATRFGFSLQRKFVLFGNDGFLVHARLERDAVQYQGPATIGSAASPNYENLSLQSGLFVIGFGFAWDRE